MGLAKPRAIVAIGHGINCDRELEYALQKAGAAAARVHVDELTARPHILEELQIFALPGGFSFGDDPFAGSLFARKIIHSSLKVALEKYLEKGNLLFGVCNGNQIGSMMNLIPVFGNYFSEPEVVFTNNSSARYEDRGNINLKIVSQKSHWLKGVEMLRNIPVGHGEGKFYTTPEALRALYERDMVALKYVREDGTPANGVYPINPNGSIDDIAGIASEHVLLLMPHPERAIYPYNQHGWTRRRSELKRRGEALHEEGDGMKIFRNAVEYFR